MKGQLSIEFMVVIAFFLTVLATITIPLYESSRATAERISALSDAREAGVVLAGMFNSVYGDGVGSKQTVEYWLPKGVAAIYARENIDDGGTPTAPLRNGRLEVQIWFDLDGDGQPDLNNREAVVVVETLLPSKWDNNGNLRENWPVICLSIEDNNFRVGSGYGTLGSRTFHRTTIRYVFSIGENRPRRVLVSDNLIERV